MSSPVVEFLRARLAEDEAAALAATGWGWTPGDGNVSEGMVYANGWAIGEFRLGPANLDDAGRQVLPRWPVMARHGQANAEHVARHDPARVLAYVTAVRRVIDLHEEWPVLVDGPLEPAEVEADTLGGLAARVTRQIAWATTREYRARFGDDPPTGPVLAALAAVYADHPDYAAAIGGGDA